MKNFYSLIPRYLMKNKKRNLFLGLSIMFSVLIITTINISFNKIISYEIEKLEKFFPVNFDLRFLVMEKNKEVLEEIDRNTFIDSSIEEIYLGKSLFKDAKDRNIEYTLTVNGYNGDLEKNTNYDFIEGKYPEQDNEIAIEKWFLHILGDDLSLGDNIKLKIRTSYLKGKETIIEKDFKLAGIVQCTSNLKTPNGSVAFVTKNCAEENNVDLAAYRTKYYTLKEGEDIALKYSKVINSVKGIFEQKEYNSTKVSLEKIISSMESIKTLGCVVISILSTILIYNIFSATISIRIKEIGMLKSLGAEKRQINLLLLGEGILIEAIFIPLGIFFGVLFFEGIQYFILREIYEFKGIGVTLQTVFLSIIFTLIPIISGISICARKVQKLSIIDTINYKEDTRALNLKEDNSFNKNYKFHRAMAIKNIKRNKNRFIGTVFSLAITIVIFMAINFISATTKASLFGVQEGMPELIIEKIVSEISEDSIEKIKNLKGIKRIDDIRRINYTSVNVPPEKITKEGVGYIEEMSKSAGEDTSIIGNYYRLPHNILGYNDDMIKDLDSFILEGKIDLEELKKENKIILGQNLNLNNVSTYSVGDKILISQGKSEDKKEYEIAAILDPKKYTIEDGIMSTMTIMSSDTFIRNYNKNLIEKANIYLKGDNYTKEIKEELTKEFNENNYKIRDTKEELEQIKKENIDMLAVLYGFSFVLAIISVFNIINVIYTNISSRKKEISMLIAIGMDKNEVKAMIINESIYYYIFSITIGLVFGTLLTRSFTRIPVIGTVKYMWTIPLNMYICIAIVMAIVCYFASLNASKVVLEDSIVEGVRAIE